jgi:hypothetical protein
MSELDTTHAQQALSYTKAASVARLGRALFLQNLVMTLLLAQNVQIFFTLPAFVLNRHVTREMSAQYSQKKKSRFTGLRASVAHILCLALINPLAPEFSFKF